MSVIRGWIVEDEELLTLAKAIPMNSELIASRLSETKRKACSYEAGKGDVIVTVGFDVGNAFCDMIESNHQFRHVKHLLSAGKMDVSLPLTQQMILSLVGVTLAEGLVFTPENAIAILALATEAEVVTEYEVRCAVLNDDGSLAV